MMTTQQLDLSWHEFFSTDDVTKKTLIAAQVREESDQSWRSYRLVLGSAIFLAVFVAAIGIVPLLIFGWSALVFPLIAVVALGPFVVAFFIVIHVKIKKRADLVEKYATGLADALPKPQVTPGL
ncbi:hypothetical protein [Demequina oxidasica]|uniref:hypothetical protein n=1 Tax=Demequina oxidasica TaxID=676199 RepID=UPI0007810B38|nr:hypothetical protein [Demequina oxidasica]